LIGDPTSAITVTVIVLSVTPTSGDVNVALLHALAAVLTGGAVVAPPVALLLTVLPPPHAATTSANANSVTPKRALN
jgi:hypothetical protein